MWFLILATVALGLLFAYLNVGDHLDDTWPGFDDRHWLLHPSMFGVYYSVLGAAGTIWFGQRVARGFGGFSSAFGRAIIFLGLAIAVYGLGNLIWSYYTTCNTWIEPFDCGRNPLDPYPSWADAAYLGMVPLAVLSQAYVSRGLGMRVRDYLPAVAIAPLILIVTGYFGFPEHTVFDWYGQGYLVYTGGTNLENFFGWLYIVADVAIATMSLCILLRARRASGGLFLGPIVVLAMTFFILFIADLTFFWQDAAGSYQDGNWNDALYGLAMLGGPFTVLLFGKVEVKLGEQLAPPSHVDTTA
jgi:hypothetical protein